jgi:hypothetical protein
MIADIESLRIMSSWGAEFVQVAERDKFPLGVKWPGSATPDIDAVEGWLKSGFNVGLLLGTGNLVDIEYDDDVGRAALRSLGLLTAKTPTWASGRGEHRLFRFDGQLPPWGWRRVGGIEARFGGKPAQSVLPPSRHPRGGKYAWLMPPTRFEPMALTLNDLGIA